MTGLTDAAEIGELEHRGLAEADHVTARLQH